MILLVMVTRLFRRQRGAGWAAAGLGVVGVFVGWRLAFDHLAGLTGVVGKDSTLTDRREMWRAAREAIAVKQWRGYGFDAFWNEPTLVNPINERLIGIIVYAHNTLPEFTLGLGWIGGGLAVLSLLWAVCGCLRWAWLRGSLAAYVWLAVLAFTVATHAMESVAYGLLPAWPLFAACVAVAWRRGRALAPTVDASPVAWSTNE